MAYLCEDPRGISPSRIKDWQAMEVNVTITVASLAHAIRVLKYLAFAASLRSPWLQILRRVDPERNASADTLKRRIDVWMQVGHLRRWGTKRFAFGGN